MKRIISKYKELRKSVRISIMLVLLVVLGSATITLSKYIYQVISANILSSQNFYFNSDLLTEGEALYTIPSWSGQESYSLNIVMNSVKNELKYATVDIDYSISYDCPNAGVVCSSTLDDKGYKSTIIANNGTNGATNHDTFTITLTPNHNFNETETAEIYVYVESTSPYVKNLSARFVLKVEKVGLSYEITDNKNDIFAQLRLTNTLANYTVKTAFGDKEVGTPVQLNEYSKLSDEDKAKCVSMNVELLFDPRVLQLDMTDPYYLKAVKSGTVVYGDYYVFTRASGSYKENQIISTSDYNGLSSSAKSAVSGPYSYVNGMSIELGALSSASIKFYKSDSSSNYTYPLINDESVIKVK